MVSAKVLRQEDITYTSITHYTYKNPEPSVARAE